MRPNKDFDLLSTLNTEKSFLSLVGIYPRSVTGKSLISYYIGRIVAFSMLIFFVATMIIFVVTNLNDTMEITETLFICISVLASLVKLTNFTINADKIALLEKLLSNEILSDSAPRNLNMMKTDIAKTQKLMKIYMFMALQAIITYFAMPFFSNNDGYRLAISSYYPWDTRKIVNFVFTYLSQVALTTLSAASNTIIETMFAKLCTIVYAEFRVLKNNLEYLDYSPRNLEVRNELGKNIRLHKELLKITLAMEHLFTYGILGQFSASIIVICFTGFHLTTTDLDEEADAFGRFSYLYACLSYLGCMLLQVSIYCVYGHDVMEESSNINQAIYLSNWYLSEVSVRKDLSILRERVKRPVVLTAGKLFFLTVATLVQILRSSYSFLAVLQQST